MLIQFSEFIPRPAPEVYAYFQTPADWGRLYGFATRVADRGEPPRRVRWEFKGFWRGRGEVRLTDQRPPTRATLPSAGHDGP